MKRAVLKPGKEKSLLKRHPWIFSGAIAELPLIEPGEILPVYSADGMFLALSYFHPTNSLAGRVLSFTLEPVEKILSEKIDAALVLRSYLLDTSQTNAYRLIHAEADGLPGLIVDYYDGVLSIQINTWGMERLKSQILSLLIEKLQPKAIFEKSTSSARELEGLPQVQGFVYKEVEDPITILENGISFKVSLAKGQKTGFFLDQRKMREYVQGLSHGKKVLNCFSYSGGFSLYALQGGASHVVSVDCSKEACLLAEENTTLNGIAKERHTVLQKDVFAFLKEDPLDFDLIILDPPAFAKKRGDVEDACRGYKEINRLCFEKLQAPSLLLTSSCSYFIDPTLFQNIVFQAAIEAGKEPRICSLHHLACDHPIRLTHPEGSYLKSLSLFI